MCIRSHSPGIKKQQLHIAEQESNRDQMKADIKLAMGVMDRVHSALIRHLFDRRLALRSKQRSDAEHPQRQSRGTGCKEQNGEEGVGHKRLPDNNFEVKPATL